LSSCFNQLAWQFASTYIRCCKAIRVKHQQQQHVLPINYVLHYSTTLTADPIWHPKHNAWLCYCALVVLGLCSRPLISNLNPKWHSPAHSQTGFSPELGSRARWHAALQDLPPCQHQRYVAEWNSRQLLAFDAHLCCDPMPDSASWLAIEKVSIYCLCYQRSLTTCISGDVSWKWQNLHIVMAPIILLPPHAVPLAAMPLQC